MSNVAEIGVRIVADASKLTSGLKSALMAVDEFGDKLGKAGMKVAALGAAITAVSSKLIADGSKYDANVKGAVDRLGNAYDHLSVRLATALIPAIQQTTALVQKLVGAWDSLSEEQRKLIASIAETTAKILLMVAAGSQIVGFVADLAGLAVMLWPVVLPVLAIAAALAGIALAIGAGYGLWKQYGAAITSATKAAFESATDFAESFFRFMIDNIKDAANRWLGLLKLILRANEEMRNSGKSENVLLGEKPGTRDTSALDKIVSVMDPLINGDVIPRAAASMKEGVIDALDTAGSAIKFGITDSFKNLKEMLGLDKWKTPEFKAAATPKLLESTRANFGPLQLYQDPGRFQQTRMGGASAAAYGTGVSGRGVDQLARAKMIAESLVGFGDALQGAVEHLAGKVISSAALWAGVSAEQVKSLMDANVGMSEATAEMVAALGNVGGALADAGTSLLGKLGKFGAAMAAGIQGFKSGGIWGAIIAVFAELIAGTQAFSDAIDIANGSFKEIAGAFEGLVRGIQPLLTAVTMVIGAVIGLLKPAFDVIGEALGSIAPVLGVIAMLLEGLAPLFEMMASTLKPVFEGLKVIIGLLSWVLSGVIYGILKVVHGIGWLWNTILNEIAGFIAKIPGLGGIADGIRSMMIDLTGVNEAIDKASKVIAAGVTGGADLVKAKEEEWKAMGKATASANDLAESLTNVASGWKISAARYAAQDGRAPGANNAGGTGTSQAGLSPGGANNGTVGDMDANGVFGGTATAPSVNVTLAIRGDDLVALVDRKQSRLGYQRKGRHKP